MTDPHFVLARVLYSTGLYRGGWNVEHLADALIAALAAAGLTIVPAATEDLPQPPPCTRPGCVVPFLHMHGNSGAVDPSPQAAEVHKPFTDDGVTYCGWDKREGCGEVWPCAYERARLAAAPADLSLGEVIEIAVNIADHATRPEGTAG